MVKLKSLSAGLLLSLSASVSIASPNTGPVYSSYGEPENDIYMTPASYNYATRPQSHAAPHQRVRSPDHGAYAGLGFGSSELTSVDGTEDFEDTNIRAHLGYQLNRYFAIEGGVSVLPMDDLLGDVADLTGVDISVLAKLPVTAKMSAYARLGYWDWDISVPYRGNYYDLVGDTDVLYGIGVEYKLSSRLKINVDATRYEIGDTEIDTLNGSLSYSF